MIHPNTELRFISDAIGYGVFATKLIPEGSITYVKDSLEIEISPEAYEEHGKQMQDVIEKYSYIDERGYRIVSWDISKYVNHCCDHNSISTGYGFEIAIRDIQPGEQLTDEYGIFNIKNKMEVFCGKENCRGCVSSDDFDKYYKSWDEKILKSLKKLHEIPQPLLELVQPDLKKELDSFFKNPKNYKSVYSLKYDPPVKETVYSSNGRK